MEKLLNLSKRQIIAVSWAAVAVGIAGILAMGAAAQDSLRQVNSVHDHKATAPADTPANDNTKPEPKPTPNTAPATPQLAEGNQQAVEPTQPQPKPQAAITPRTDGPATPGVSDDEIIDIEIKCTDTLATVCDPVDKLLDVPGQALNRLGL